MQGRGLITSGRGLFTSGREGINTGEWRLGQTICCVRGMC